MSDKQIAPEDYVLGALKFFTHKEHAEAFVQGKILMNSIKHFQTIETGQVDGRVDEDEGLAALIQPTPGLILKFGDHQIAPKDIMGPVQIRMQRDLSKNLLCIYALFSDGYLQFKDDEIHLVDPTSRGLAAINEHVKMSERCFDMGKFTVVIHNIHEFQERLIRHALENHFQLTVGRVQYYEKKTHHGKFAEPGLHKRNEFSWQREYRFILDRGSENAEPYTVDLGPLHDICEIIESAQVKSGFQFVAERLPAI